MNVDLERVRELVALVRDSQIYELTISDGDSRITIKRRSAAEQPEPPGPAAAASPAPADLQAAPGGDKETVGGVDSTEEQERAAGYVPVTAEWVGTVYLGDGPDAAPLVSVGERVEAGQKVCVIESMRLMHDVTTPVSGTVVQILAEDNQPVEYGETLMLVQSDEGK